MQTACAKKTNFKTHDGTERSAIKREKLELLVVRAAKPHLENWARLWRVECDLVSELTN